MYTPVEDMHAVMEGKSHEGMHVVLPNSHCHIDTRKHDLYITSTHTIPWFKLITTKANVRSSY